MAASSIGLACSYSAWHRESILIHRPIYAESRGWPDQTDI